MHPMPFSYHKAESIDDALRLLGEFDGDGKILSGGQSLLPVMKLRLASPAHLVDISGLPGLSGVSHDGDTIVLGALTTHADLAVADIPLLSEIAHVVGDLQVRNLGTIGGAIAHADPAADYPAGVLALDVEIVAQGPNGTRTLPIADFFHGFMTTALEPNEILTQIRIPALPADTGVSYQKLANPASGYATAGVAAVVTRATDGSISEIRIAITGASELAYRATDIEDALRGTTPDEAAVKAAAASAVSGRDLLSDAQASADYRAKVVPNLVRRAILTALQS
ncbi:MAG: xanthine dehydrogenase family protein subunit M [Thermomicrobiales bacterium]